MMERPSTLPLVSRSRVYRKVNALVRYGMVHLASRSVPLYVVNEFPRSGGTWVGQMLSAALGVPFPRNRLPLLRPSVMHGHYLSPWGMRNVVTVWRDPRDVLVSLYYASLFPNEITDPRVIAAARRAMAFSDLADTRTNLPTFIQRSFSGEIHPGFSWTEFVRRWHGRSDVVHVRYEDLRAAPTRALMRIVSEVANLRLEEHRAEEIVERFSFARLAKRSPGEENPHSVMRKGTVGDWQNHFSRESRELVHEYAGSELIQLGYERDSSWM